MDDRLYGADDGRGAWTPKKTISYGPAFAWPPQPRALFKWFFGYPGYFLPWNVLYAVLALLIWTFLTPPLEAMRELAPGWVALIFFRNVVLAVLVYGAWHLWLYVFAPANLRLRLNGKPQVVPGAGTGARRWLEVTPKRVSLAPPVG